MSRCAGGTSWKSGARRRRCQGRWAPMLDRLYAELADGDLRLVQLTEAHREPLRAACAADAEVWAIYATSFDPDHFDARFTAMVASAAQMPSQVLHGDRLVGLTAGA